MTSFMGPRPSLLFPVLVHYCQLMPAKNKCQLTLLSLLFQHKLLVWMVLYLCIHYTSENCHTFQGMFISRAHRMDSSHSTLLARRGMLGLWSCSLWQGLGWTCRPRWALLQHWMLDLHQLPTYQEHIDTLLVGYGTGDRLITYTVCSVLIPILCWYKSVNISLNPSPSHLQFLYH